MASSKQDKLNAAKACFEYNSDATECFVTDDLATFLNKNHAANHASGLAERSIDHFTRSTDAVADPDNTATFEPGQPAADSSAQRLNNPDVPAGQTTADTGGSSAALAGTADTTGTPAADVPVDTTGTPAADAPVDSTTAAPADPADPAATTADSAATAATADSTADAPSDPAANVSAEADALPATNSTDASTDSSAEEASHDDVVKHIVEEIVDEVEHVLGINAKKTGDSK